MSSMTPAQDFNEDQRTRWDGIDGEYWTSNQDRLDRTLAPPRGLETSDGCGLYLDPRDAAHGQRCDGGRTGVEASQERTPFGAGCELFAHEVPPLQLESYK